MELNPVKTPEARKLSAANTASLPIEILSAPARKYCAATSSADQYFPEGSVYSRMPPPTVSGTNTSSDELSSTCSMGRSPITPCRKLVMFRNTTY